MSRTPTDEEKEDLKELESEDENEDDSKSEDGYVPVQYPSSSSDSDSDSDTDSDTDSDESEVATDFFDPDSYKGGVSEDVLKRKLNPKLSRRVRVGNAVDLCAEASITAKKDVKESVTAIQEQQYNFPPDPENWREEDMGEVWADAPVWTTKPGFDPFCVDEKEARLIKKELDAGREPPIAPFYLPFRKYYPVVPKKYPDISTPKEVIEELDRIEEFLKWVSYIFEDGSSYEGTVWDDVAHGKGVRVALNGMVRYEGEWFRNDMEGHGVVEVDVPFMEPIPGSKHEEQMRAEGEIISRDFMSPEDREWLEKDIEDSLMLANGKYETPFYETKLFMHKFGMTPEKGRYRYAGQWKHGRAHGCGVYEVNEQPTFGRFYFGQLMEDDTHGCDAEVSAMHAGIAEVAAAKARMFVNKPDGMVREYRGPYSDPQHPYMYEEEDVWMAPGFINQFYEVPDYWKMYVHEVDQEREMWLNSFYRAPLRLPMPAELEYWWWNVDENPEFVLLNQELQPDPEDPSKLIQPEDPVILHTPTGRIINYVEDEEHGIRLFWQPPGSKIDPDKAVFLPLGFDEFYGKEMVAVEQPFWIRIRNGFVDIIEGLKGWAEGKKEDIEEKIEQLEKELALVDAELDLKENMEYMDSELAKLQKEAERKAAQGIVEEEEEDVSMSSQPVVDEEGEGVSMSKPVKELEKIPVMKELERTPAVEKKEDEDDDDDEDDDVVDDDDDEEVEVKEDKVDDKDDDDDDEDEDDGAPSSFGSVEDQNRENGNSRFAASSLSFAGSNVFSLIPPKLQSSFMRWKEGKFQKQSSTPTPTVHPLPLKTHSFSTVRLSPTMGNNIKSLKLRYTRQAHCMEHISRSSSRQYRSKRRDLVETEHTLEHFSILSWHTPLTM